MVNVGKYTIHGSYGNKKQIFFPSNIWILPIKYWLVNRDSKNGARIHSTTRAVEMHASYIHIYILWNIYIFHNPFCPIWQPPSLFILSRLTHLPRLTSDKERPQNFCKKCPMLTETPSMGRTVYLPTWMVDFYGNVGKYTIHGCYGLWSKVSE